MPSVAKLFDSMPSVFDAEKAGEILGVPTGYCVVAMTPLGYPDELPEPRPRKELSEIISYDRFASK